MPNTGRFDEETRMYIMAEIAAQLKPFAKLLDDLKEVTGDLRDWQLGFWSNGVGKVPGFFQNRMKEDDKRRQEEDDRHAQVKKDLKEQNDRLAPLVAYVEEHRILKEHRQARWEFWWPIIKWVGGGLGLCLLGLATYLGPKIVKAGTIIWDEYEKFHPGVTQKLKDIGTGTDPAYTSRQKQAPQDAAGDFSSGH
jgi:hypothetical protein